MRYLWRLFCGCGVMLLILVGTAGPASAHAQLESTSPTQSSVVEVAPSQVVLHFGEPVEIDFGSLRVIGPNGQRVDSGGTHHPRGDSHAVAISLPAHLPRGTYVVAWRVISADSHPVHGAFVFSVSSASGAGKANSLATALGNQSGSATVGAFYWLIRFAAFAGLLFLVGLASMVTLVWRPGGATRRVGRVLWISWWVLLASTLLGIAIQGVYAAALPLTDIVRPSLFTAVLQTRFGRIEVLRLLLLAAFVPVLLRIQGRLGKSDHRWAWVVPAQIVLGVALLFTTGLAGHASTGSQPTLGLALDVLHLASAAVWLGGLALVATFLVANRDGADQPADPLGVTLKVSAYAFSAVVVVVATGTFQSIRQVGSLYALFHTVYGRTLLVKIGLVVVLIGLGAVSRRIVHGTWGLRRQAQPVAREASATAQSLTTGVGRLRRSVLAEIAIALAVLAVTALLVNAVPAQQAAGLPFSYSFNALGLQVNMIVDPARAGPGNQFHIYVLSNLGTPKAVPELDASISLPTQNLGPLSISLVVGGPGHFYATNVDIPIAGTWILKITLRTDAIDEQVVSTPLPVH
ncbi:MAG TPA: copper resistance protein CopC [Acidimicrobiales bacterium]|nr:copper resistance protein CopC [Acidimicrobiales bacterium]